MSVPTYNAYIVNGMAPIRLPYLKERQLARAATGGGR